ncbi:hypothetical protein L7F22_045324 [Adiantum nelumboides]|nr:hypothetical protein [Adiantum nelumboides]
MSSKPPKPSFNSTPYEHPFYPLYMTPHDDFYAAAVTDQPSVAVSDHFFSSRANVEDVQAMAGAVAGGGAGLGQLSVAERFKRWSFEQERTTFNSELQSYSMSPFLGVNNDHNLLSNHAAGGGEGGGGGEGSGRAAIADMLRETGGGAGHANLLNSLGSSSVGDGVNVGFLPVSNSNTAAYRTEEGYSSTDKPQYGTAQADMEILRVTQGHNPVSGSVHLFEDIPSALNHQSVGLGAAPPSNYNNLSYGASNATHRASSTTNLDQSNTHQSQFLSDHRHHHPQWGPALRTSNSAGAHHIPHAELLLLPGVAVSVVEAPPSSATASFGSNKLDLLHVSSLHDKQAPMALPLGVAGAGGRPPSAVQMWNADKLDMAVGLGLHDSSARNTLSFPDTDHYASMRAGLGQSDLSLFLQSPQAQRAQSIALSLDAARYNSRSASGSLGVLRNSKYLKATQQLLNEFCSVSRDGYSVQNVAKSSSMSMSYNNMQWSTSAGAPGEEDHGQLSRAFFSTTSASSAGTQKSSHQYNSQLKDSTVSSSGGSNNNQQQQQQEIKAAAQTSTPDHVNNPKQLPADDRCHLQMRKARLIAMVEEVCLSHFFSAFELLFLNYFFPPFVC